MTMAVVFGKSSYPIKHVLYSHTHSGVGSSSNNSSLYSPHSQNFDDLDVRKRTFLLWPPWAAANGNDLAEAGFHYTGITDEVACHACLMKHSNWQHLDDPLEVHLREGRTCMVARGRSAALASQTNSRNHRSNRRRVGQGHFNFGENEEQREPLELVTPAAPRVIEPRQSATRVARHNPNFDLQGLSDETTRFHSFENKWNKSFCVLPEDLAKAGFFYKGPGDRVQCAFCKGILKDWELGDNALGEHTRHYPACPFVAKLNSEATSVMQMRSALVMINMGYDEKDVVEAVVNLQKQGKATPSTDDLVEMLFTMKDVKTKTMEDEEQEEEDEESFSSSPEAQQLKRENAVLRQSAICKVCFTAPVDTLLLPCRHLSCCADCAANSDYCPSCRAKILGTVKTYMA